MYRNVDAYISSFYSAFFLIAFAVGLFSWLRAILTKHTLRIDGAGFEITKTRGKKILLVEPITTVTGDQIQFHLFSKSGNVSIFKKNLPRPVIDFLASRVDRETT